MRSGKGVEWVVEEGGRVAWVLDGWRTLGACVAGGLARLLVLSMFLLYKTYPEYICALASGRVAVSYAA